LNVSRNAREAVGGQVDGEFLVRSLIAQSGILEDATGGIGFLESFGCIGIALKIVKQTINGREGSLNAGVEECQVPERSSEATRVSSTVQAGWT
jgi:hypothetical protein